jgi:hypothetical protein
MTRRYLLSGAAAAALAVPVFAQRGSIGRGAPDPSVDPVLEEITRQLEQAATQLQSGPSGEAARRLAAATRMWGAWARANRFDDAFRSTLRAAIAREGRDAFIARQFDSRAEAKLRGFTLPPNTGDVSRADRSKVLDELLRSGISDGLGRLANVWEAAAPTIDRRFGAVAPIALRQLPECTSANASLMYSKTVAFALCMPPAVLEPAGPALCAAAGASVLALEWYVWYLGC